MVCGAAAMGDTGLKGQLVNGFRTGVVDGIKIIEQFDRRALANNFVRYLEAITV